MFKNSSLFNEASILKTPKNIPLQILIFIAVFIVIAIAESILSCIYVLPAMFNYLADNNVSVSDSNYMDTVLKFQSDTKVMIVSLFSTISATVITMVYCRFIEGRPLSSMGIRKKNLASHYFFGVLTGLVLMSAIVALEVAFGGIKISSFSFKLNYGFFFLYLFGFFFQGMSEEFIFRGYLMNSIGGCGKPVAAIIISSCAFSAAHLLNPGVSPLAVFNLFLLPLSLHSGFSLQTTSGVLAVYTLCGTSLKVTSSALASAVPARVKLCFLPPQLLQKTSLTAARSALRAVSSQQLSLLPLLAAFFSTSKTKSLSFFALPRLLLYLNSLLMVPLK